MAALKPICRELLYGSFAGVYLLAVFQGQPVNVTP